MKAFLGPLGGKGEEETCCVEFPAHEVDWGFRKPFFPDLFPWEADSEHSLSGAPTPREGNEGVVPISSSWTNCSPFLKLRVPLPGSNSEHASQ